MRILCIAMALGILASCNQVQNESWLKYPANTNQTLASLVKEARTVESSEIRLVLIEQVMDDLVNNYGPLHLAHLIQEFLLHFPDDQYEGYLLFRVGKAYAASSQPELARAFFAKAVALKSSLLLGNAGVTRLALEELVKLPIAAAEKARFFNQLINEFRDHPNLAAYLVQAGAVFEKLGEWQQAKAMYSQLKLNPRYYSQLKPGEKSHVDRYLLLSNAVRPNWSFSELDLLIANLRNAFIRRSATSLSALRRPNNFFTKSAILDEDDFNSQIDFGIILRFLQSTRAVRVAETAVLHVEGEEYTLLVSGISTRVPDWYLVLRRIDFPANPVLHNTWEWAGIIMGDNF